MERRYPKRDEVLITTADVAAQVKIQYLEEEIAKLRKENAALKKKIKRLSAPVQQH